MFLLTLAWHCHKHTVSEETTWVKFLTLSLLSVILSFFFIYLFIYFLLTITNKLMKNSSYLYAYL